MTENVKTSFAETVPSAKGSPPARELQLGLQHCTSNTGSREVHELGAIQQLLHHSTAAAPVGSSDAVYLQRRLAV